MKHDNENLTKNSISSAKEGTSKKVDIDEYKKPKITSNDEYKKTTLHYLHPYGVFSTYNPHTKNNIIKKEKSDDKKFVYKDDESDESDEDDESDVSDDDSIQLEAKIYDVNKNNTYEEEEDEDDEEDEDEDYFELSSSKKTNDVKSISSHTQIQLDSLSTEGMPYDIYTTSIVKKHLTQCEYCQKFFPSDLIIKWDSTTCAHCYFWTHYNEYVREEADGMFMYISDYIKKCNNDHDCYECASSMKAGCCFICDYIDGNELKWIKERSRLFDETNKTINYSLNSQSESDNEFEIEI